MKKGAGLTTLIMAGSALIVIGSWKSFDYLENRRIERRMAKTEIVLGGHTGVKNFKSVKVQRGDVYWNMLGKIDGYDCLRGLRREEIVSYLQKINPGKEAKYLKVGDELKIPTYNPQTCKKLVQ